MPDENPIPTESAKPDPKPDLKPDPKILGQSVALAIVIATVIVVIIAVWMHDYRPWTDDATLRANFIGVAPHVSGHIVDLRIQDNQFVNEGDVLFVVDPRPYEDALASAKAGLSLTRKEVATLKDALKVAEASILRAEAQELAAEATVERAQAEYKDADDHVKRLEPLLVKEFATADQLESARTRRVVADAAVALGFHISFSGIVTFKNAGALKDVARQVPLERLLVETDSPYLAPVPHRGKINRPALVLHVAEEVARLRGISLGDLAAATTGNFFRIFKEGQS